MSNLRIGAVLNILFVTTLFLLVGNFSLSLKKSYDQKVTAEHISDSSALLNNVFIALQNMRVERSDVRIAITGDTPVTAARTETIANLRAKSLPAFAAVIDACKEMNCGRVALADLQKSFDDLSAMRVKADKFAALSLADRPVTIKKEWEESSTKAIDALSLISRDIGVDLRQTDPIVAELIDIKDFGYAIRAAAGLQRNVYTEAIKSAALTPENQKKAAALGGEINVVWPMLQDLAYRDAVDPKIKESVEQVQKSYFDKIIPLSDSVATAILSGQPSPIGFEEFQKTTNQSFDIIVAVPFTALAVMEEHVDRMNQDAVKQLIINAALLAFVLLIGVFGIFIVRNKVVAPLAKMTEAMLDVASGKLDGEVPYAARKDEIGELAGALAIFKENAKQREAAEAATRREEALKEKRSIAIDSMIKEFEGNIARYLKDVCVSSADMQTTAQDMSGYATGTSNEASIVAQSAQQTAASVQTVAAATEEMSAAVSEIARQVEVSTNIVGRAVIEAESTNVTVSELAQSAQRIGEVIEMINQIAEQTNLLALNATIEAARAGDAGKGFAVVANEVKALSTQTAKATEEISGHITSMRLSTEKAVEAILNISKTVKSMNEISSTISSAVEEQSVVTQGITQNLHQANDATDALTSSIVNVSAVADKTGIASKHVLDAAQNITSVSGSLSTEIRGFLTKIKAA